MESPTPLPSNHTQPEVTEDDLNVDYPQEGHHFKPNTGVNIPGILAIVSRIFGLPSGSTVPTISSFSHGVFNRLFLVTFDGTEVIARIPFPQTRDDSRFRSDIATTIYIRQYTTIPAPRLFAWCTHDRNDAGVPYVLMERLPGTPMKGQFSDMMTLSQRKSFLDQVAKIHAQLLKPLPFSRLGNLNLAGEDADEGIDHETIRAFTSRGEVAQKRALDGFVVGPFIPNPKVLTLRRKSDVPEPSAGSYASLPDYWRAKMDVEFDAAYKRWGNPRTDQVLELEGKFGSWCNADEEFTTVGFGFAYQDLKVIASSYRPPSAELDALCFSHHDFSFHNFLIDDEGSFNITGIIDWEDVCILPTAAALRYPSNLVWPIPRDSGDLIWHLWTPNPLPPVIGKPNAAYPAASDWDEIDKQVFIDRSWDRGYYRAKLGELDARFGSHAWEECKMTLHIHEIVLGHWSHWLYAQKWLAETSGRLCNRSLRDRRGEVGDVDEVGDVVQNGLKSREVGRTRGEGPDVGVLHSRGEMGQ